MAPSPGAWRNNHVVEAWWFGWCYRASQAVSAVHCAQSQFQITNSGLIFETFLTSLTILPRQISVSTSIFAVSGFFTLMFIFLFWSKQIYRSQINSVFVVSLFCEFLLNFVDFRTVTSRFDLQEAKWIHGQKREPSKPRAVTAIQQTIYSLTEKFTFTIKIQTKELFCANPYIRDIVLKSHLTHQLMQNLGADANVWNPEHLESCRFCSLKSSGFHFVVGS